MFTSLTLLSLVSVAINTHDFGTHTAEPSSLYTETPRARSSQQTTGTTRDSSAPGPAARIFDHTHSLWNQTLAQNVRGDGFDYASVKKRPDKLTAYLDLVHGVTPDELGSWTAPQRFAFWINVYNAHTVKKVVDNYPIKSIKKLSGVFGFKSVFDEDFIDMPLFKPGGKGKKLSLNDIEHKILRRQFKDARLHSAVNCASHSCPPLRNEAFTADKLDAQLGEQMRAFINDPKRNQFDKKKDLLRLSKIFDWFQEDFKRDAGSVRAYLIRYAPPEDAEFIRTKRIKFLSYDWALNDVEPTD
ncbi:MAG: hypothetical protein CMJ89_08375 [Planctomycetes bacterium]|jgi:hypothetical protein|nr:hypothetical protein [Planctomycetota bacterium]